MKQTHAQLRSAKNAQLGAKTGFDHVSRRDIYCPADPDLVPSLIAAMKNQSDRILEGHAPQRRRPSRLQERSSCDWKGAETLLPDIACKIRTPARIRF